MDEGRIAVRHQVALRNRKSQPRVGASQDGLARSLVSGAGNQAMQRIVARAGRAGARGRTLSRVVLAVGDLAELERKREEVSPDERRHAETISTAARNRVTATRERQVDPWDERFRPFKPGPLATIGDEDLRIYGHGGTRRNEDVVSQVGGYTASALAAKLINMGLPESYAGEIYLTGCNTAKGDDDGFLGAFYKPMSAHCPRVRARGNIAASTTFEDGTQGVWTGNLPSEATIKETIGALQEEVDKLIATAQLTHAMSQRSRNPAIKAALIKQGQQQVPDYGAQVQALIAQKRRLELEAYSSDPGFTRVLPR
jgi:hypothetical protein